MKFFSNEAKENDRTDDDSAAVPQQRAGSPWGDTPRDADEQAGDRPGDQPGERPGDVDRPWSQASPEAVHTTTTYGPDGSVVTEPDHHRDGVGPDGDLQSPADRDGDLRNPGDRDGDGDVDRHDRDIADADLDSDKRDPLDSDKQDPLDSDKRDPLDEPNTLDKSILDNTDHRDESDRADESALTDKADRTDKSEAIQDAGTFDSPKAVEPATGEPLNDSRDTADAEPVVATAAVPAAPAATTTTGDRLFPEGDSFAERFRDIQLRFVDSPKEATAEAATLVGEALDSLTDNLRSQRQALAGDSDDTERLRVELRGYRELLNRLVNL